jgi:hypothetical protein
MKMVETMNTMKTVANGAVGLVLALVGGVVAMGDRIIQVGTALLQNEFFLMFATIVGFFLLMGK